MELTTQRTGFQPVSVMFTLESQQELDAMTSLFNFEPFNSALSKVSGANTMMFYRCFKDIGGVTSLVDNWTKQFNRMCHSS